MLSRSQKEQLVKDLAEKIKAGKVAIFSDFSGTSVGNMQKLRRELRSNGAAYKIAKKRLMEIAFKNAGIEIDVKSLNGQIGVAVGEADEVSAAKVLANFSKKNKNFKILAGILEEKLISAQEVMALAKLPSREELLAKFVGSINAPVSGFVNVLAGNIRGLLTALKGIADSKQAM